MTREEILSIEGVKEHFKGGDIFTYGDIQFLLGTNRTVTSIVNNYEQIDLKPIFNIETLKQFLNYFDYKWLSLTKKAS
jgi:hypothetical protein